MTEKVGLNRREFLKATAMTAMGVLAASCARATPQVIEKEVPVEKVVKETVVVEKQVPVEKVVKETVVVEKQVPVEKVVTATPVPAKYGEAPMLAELVKAGKLPPVEERLPAEPLVLPVVEEIGQYGGTWRRAWKGPSDTGGPARLWPEALLHWSVDGTGFEPNIFSKWEIGDGGRTITCKIRQGIKWSDGTPVTADDFVYWYQDVMLNTELTPAFPTWMKVKGKPGSIEKVDNFTVQFKFQDPYPLFVMMLAIPRDFWPRHYMRQFHAAYVDKAALDAKVKEAKFERWDQLYGAKANQMDNPELPTLNPWVVTTRMAEPRYVAERNPYYFKVDPKGNQLPYIDRIVHDLVTEGSLYPTKAIAGELDMQERHLGTADVPLLKENEKKGDYRVLFWTPLLGSSFTVMFNQTFEADPVVAKYITNAKFRQALSIAIDRDDINRVMFLGRGTPRQATVMDISPDFKPEYAQRYIKYDVAQANKWLDELGLDKRDSEGYRIAPENGQTLTLIIYFATGNETGAELIATHWKKVGIKAVLKGEERGTHYQRMDSNELQVSLWGMDGALYPIWLDYAYWIVPWVGGSNRIGRLYGLYRDTGGKEGKKPEGPMAEALNYFDQARDEVDDKKRIELASKVLDIASENVWTIGTVLLAEAPVVVKNNFRNVPEKAVSDWQLRTPKNTHPEQYFFKK